MPTAPSTSKPTSASTPSPSAKSSRNSPRRKQATLIFSGGQQADWDSHALGAATAERLNWPQATWTSALELKGTTLTGKHDVDEGSESFTLELPAVVTTQQGLNEPRYPTLPNIMKSKKKEMRKESLDDPRST